MNNLFVIRKKRESEKELVGQQGINLRPEIAFPPSSSIGQQWLDGPVDHLALGGVVRRRLASRDPCPRHSNHLARTLYWAAVARRGVCGRQAAASLSQVQ